MAFQLELDTVHIEKPDEVNIVVRQAHFVKAVDDLHEAIVQIAPQARFGVAFCEASGPRLVRRSGTDAEMISYAERAAWAIGAGHSFVIMLRNVYPASVLNAIKAVPEVCGLFCATANSVRIVVVKGEFGNAIVGVMDGGGPLERESEADVAERRALVKRLGYKL